MFLKNAKILGYSNFSAAEFGDRVENKWHTISRPLVIQQFGLRFQLFMATAFDNNSTIVIL